MKNRSAFFYIIIVLSLLVVAVLVFILAPGNEPDTPAVLLPTAAPTDAAVTPDTFSGDQTIAVTPETVQAVIRTLHRIDCYSRTLSVRDYWSGGSRSRSIDVWSHGENLRLTVRSSNDSVQEHFLLRGNEKWIWYSDADGVFRGTAMDGDADAYQTILTYEDVLSLPAKAILDAGYVDFQGVYCIFLRYRSGSLGYESECFVDPATGLLMGERCYDGETLIYSMDSTLPDISVPDDSIFVAP